MADLSKLPEGVVMEILSRVPLDSLDGLKLVSKSWYALFTDPKFCNSLPKQNVLVQRVVVTNKETKNREAIFSILKFPFLYCGGGGDDDTSPDIEDIPFPSLGDAFRLPSINGHSHGLVCLFLAHGEVFFYNPSTAELRKLPPSILLIPDVDPFGDDLDSQTDAIGFGYDPKSGDFKVVRIVLFVLPPSNFLPRRVEVYDMRKDEWREIITPIPGRFWWAPSFEMYYQGFYYWWAEYEEVEIILSFDMSEEVFIQIPVPEGLHEKKSSYRSLGNLNGSIVLFDYPLFVSAEDEISFDIWKMVKLEGVVSWSKLFTIGPVSGIRFPLAFVGFNQLLMESYEGQLILYNMKTRHFKHLPLQGVPRESRAIVFENTSLSVNGSGHN